MGAHITFLLLSNKLPQTLRLETTTIYYLTVSVGQGPSMAQLGFLVGQTCYYVTTNSPLGDTEDYTRDPDDSGTEKSDFVWLHFTPGSLKGVLSLFTSLKKRPCFCSPSSK